MIDDAGEGNMDSDDRDGQLEHEEDAKEVKEQEEEKVEEEGRGVGVTTLGSYVTD